MGWSRMACWRALRHAPAGTPRRNRARDFGYAPPRQLPSQAVPLGSWSRWKPGAMPSRYPYQTTIRNEYLGTSKVIRATSPDELEWLIESQISKWQEQEARKRQQRQKEMQRAAAKQ